MYDVLVIGAGICGTSVASFLSRYRVKVALVDKATDVCEGSSKANTAIVHSGHDAEPGSLKAKYNVLGNKMYEQLCAELDVPFIRNSTMIAAFSQDELQELDRIEANSATNNVDNIRRISREEAQRLEPNIGESITGALIAGNGGIVSPYDLVIALAENAVINDVQLKLETKITSLSRDSDNIWTLTDQKGNRYQAKYVVNCAGLWADELNNSVSGEKYHITPRKGEYLIVDKSHTGDFTASICPVPSKMATGHTKGIWVAPTVSGTILLGPTAEDVSDKDDVSNTSEGFDKILAGARKIWNNLPTWDIISSYAGLRAHCDRNDFVIGEAYDAPGFINCAGIESPGITAGPAIGKDIADNLAEKLHAEPNKSYITGRAPHKKPFRYMTEEERAAAVAQDPAYGRIVCRCETVPEAEIRDCIRRPVGARNLDAVKRRTRAGMGRCQAGFCTPRTMQILSEELGLSAEKITKFGPGSELVVGTVFGESEAE